MADDTTIVGLGDTAQRQHFESLISIDTERPLGPIEAAKLVPWVPPYLQEYLVVVADPRSQSVEWRQAIQYLHSEREGNQNE